MHVGGIMGSQSSLLEFLPAWIFMILQKDRRGEMQELAAGCQTRTCSRQEDGRIPDLDWWTGERAIYQEYPLYWRTSGIQLAEELKVFSASWSSILWMVPFLLLSAQLWIFFHLGLRATWNQHMEITGECVLVVMKETFTGARVRQFLLHSATR